MTLLSSMKRKGQLAQKIRPDNNTLETSGAAGQLGSMQLLAFRADDVAARSLPAASRTQLPEHISLSSATYQARDPCADATILETVPSGSRPHIFAAVLTSEPTAHGGDFLRRNLHKELQSQVAALRGDVISAFKSTLAHLDLKFRALHVNNSHVLDGTLIAAAYVDLAAQQLFLASNGGCRAVIGSRDALGRSEVALDLGRPAAPSPDSTSSAAAAAADGSAQHRQVPKAAAGLYDSGGRLTNDSFATLPLDGDVESITLGSAGFWRELPAHQAALRVATVPELAPHATGGNTAANLVQLALQSVAKRVSSSSDPRMAVLKDAPTLQQLWTGSKRNWRWGGRQPLRRRRGDVHGDLSALVLRFDWAGSDTLPKSSLVCKRSCALRAGQSVTAMPRSSSGASISSAASFGSLRAAGRASHWDLVRAHFLHFRPAAAAAARRRWHAAVDAAIATAAAAKSAAAAAAAAEALPAADIPAAAVSSPMATGKPAAREAVISMVADSRPATVSPQQQEADAAAAEERAARRRVLATTSYRRLPSINRLNLQQLPVH